VEGRRGEGGWKLYDIDIDAYGDNEYETNNINDGVTRMTMWQVLIKPFCCENDKEMKK
jgi:hypothetical protein